MDWARQLVLQGGVDAALTLHTCDALKRSRNQPDMKMGFAMAAIVARGAGMAGMARALILNFQQGG
jgi:hypothetical protein